MVELQKFLVFRKASGNEKARYERFQVPVKPGLSVLDALFYIQDYYDSTFAFRYACRGAICGSCGMTIDGVPMLACKTQVSNIKEMQKPANLPEFRFGELSSWDEEKEILIQPLPNMKIIKDLVVDMEPFWKFYKEVKPYFTREWNDVAPESKQQASEIHSIEKLVYCILCGCCWACPVNSTNDAYFGPAALAKSYRFLNDTRLPFNGHQKEILDVVKQENAVPACERHFVCNRVCPKGVQPGTAIQGIKKKLESNE